MRLFLTYVRSRLATAAVFVLCAGIFALILTLYHVPAAPAWYAAALSAALGSVTTAVGFLRFRARHRRLEALREEVSLSLASLPPAESPLEADYQALLERQRADSLRDAGRMQRRYAEMSEYYTLWAHQIKTPIAAMSLLLGEEDTPRSRELSAELRRIRQYVEMVLGYIRLESDSTDYVIREWALDDILRQALRNYASQFIRKKLKLRFEPTDCTVLTDEKWLLFVIEQVLSNALKYTREGGITITLREPKTLVITDTGIGIAPEDLSRVFEKGFTGYNGRADKKASGIGLYLCRRILRRLGHDISLQSQPGWGTSVFLYLNTRKLETE